MANCDGTGGCCGGPATRGLTQRPYTYVKTVQGVCRQCRRVVNARVVIEDGRVWQERLCPEHGPARALIADDAAWYLQVMKRPVVPREPLVRATEQKLGCPLDCGLCRFHASRCNLPVFSVTNACNLDCPICFTYNRRDRIWHMPLEELDRLLDRVIESSGELDLINITGGEPTLHPRILELIDRARSRPEIGRVTMNSNGIKIASDPAFCQELARLGVYVILSLDTFVPERSMKIHGRDLVQIKQRALANLERFDIGTTILNVMIRHENEDEIGRILDLAAGKSFIRSVTIQTMTYTGQGGKSFPRDLHMTVDGAQRAIEMATAGRIRAADFHPMPSAHPLCYGISYFFREGGRLVPFRSLFSEEEVRRLMGPHYLIHPGDAFNELLNDAIHRLWAEGGDPSILALLKQIIKKIFPADRTLTPFERQRVAQEHVLTCYVHAHMDEDNFDLARVSTCPDLVPDVSGTLTPACSYNVFYRMRDGRFWEPDGDS
ncbi:MAG: radical SAM protein [Candidatus Riflebacteria bacterium]|nr:radical SAM protein [Candidatus Riflebacteria bacterium]